MRTNVGSPHWNLGTTSLRPAGLTSKNEILLKTLDALWTAAGADTRWEKNPAIQQRFSEMLAATGSFKDKDGLGGGGTEQRARTRTSGLEMLGLVTKDRKITPAGYELFRLQEARTFERVAPLAIRRDSQLYLAQLMKATVRVGNTHVRPLVVLIYLLTELGSVSLSAFSEVLPLCVNDMTTRRILHQLRKRPEMTDADYDALVLGALTCGGNMQAARQEFTTLAFPTDAQMSDVVANRKGPQYDGAWVGLYRAVRAAWEDQQTGDSLQSSAGTILAACRRLKKPAGWWQKHLFEKTGKWPVLREETGLTSAQSLAELHGWFFDSLHVSKERATLADYRDLNRRYLSLAEIFHFTANSVSLTLPAQALFEPIAAELYRDIAFAESTYAGDVTGLLDVHPAIRPAQSGYMDRLRRLIHTQYNVDIDTTASVDADWLRRELDRLRLDDLLATRFTVESLAELLEKFETRHADREACDNSLHEQVTDNADAPTMLEYVVGLCWYVISGRQGDLTSYLRMSLDADLLPVSHAKGGGADIVYDYPASSDMPAHQLLLEVTLHDPTRERQAEMEPVSRHLGDHLQRPGASPDSYCVYLSTGLDPTLVEDFRTRLFSTYYGRPGSGQPVEGMLILPLLLAHLRTALKRRLSYAQLHRLFHAAPDKRSLPSHEWVDWLTHALADDEALRGLTA